MKISTKRISLVLATLVSASALYAQNHYCSFSKAHLSQDKKAEMTQKFQDKKAGITRPAVWMNHTPLRNGNPVVNPMACDSVTSTFAGGNGQNGNMFDVTAINDITITQFYGSFDNSVSASGMVKVYYKAGSYMGSEAIPSAWTLIDSMMVTSAGTGMPTPIPITINIPVPMGQTYAFYVTGTGTMDVDYTNGTTEGAVYKSDANMQFKEGIGISYPFGSTYRPRIWNGTVFYCEGIVGVNEQQNNASVSLAPNPTSDKSVLSFGTAVNGEVAIFDMMGKQVKRFEVSNATQLEISREGLNAGVYFVNVMQNGQSIAVKRMVVN
jgi:hypothetical protein